MQSFRLGALDAAMRAVDAARRLMHDSSLVDEPPLEIVVALHIGTAIYGNIGAADHDGRNNALFLAIGPEAREIFAAGGTLEQLFDYAMCHNREAAEPMDTEEVAKIVGSVWKMTERGDNHIGQHGVYMQSHEIEDLTSDAFHLLAFLRAHQGRSAPDFWIANGLSETLGWTVKRLAAARLALIERGLVRLIRRPSQGRPARYVWP